MSLLLLLDPTSAPGDPPPWWFFASICLAIIAAGLFLLRLATTRGRKRARARPCPACAMPLQPAWIRCPGCGAEVPSAPAGASLSPAPRAPAHVGPAQLEFRTGPLVGRAFTLEHDITTIGSVEGNTVLLQDTGVSRKHAGIRKIDGGYELADLGSTNGVYVNGEKTARRKLVNGDVVRIGTSEAVFRG